MKGRTDGRLEFVRTGDLFMNLTGVSAGLNFAAYRVALRWAKEHLPKEGNAKEPIGDTGYTIDPDGGVGLQ